MYLLRNFLTISFRIINQQKFYSLLNVIGLITGITCTLLLYLWIRDEFEKDGFHYDADRIYMVVSNSQNNTGNPITWKTAPGPLAEEITEKIPQVEMAVRRVGYGQLLFASHDKNLVLNGYWADPDFFKLFNFPILEGARILPLQDKSWVAISASLAKRLFGDDKPLGKVIRVQNRWDVQVITVFNDVTSQSSMTFDFILPHELFKEYRNGEKGYREGSYGWDVFDHTVYLKLKSGADPQEVSKHIGEYAGLYRSKDEPVEFYLQPFTDEYLHGRFENGRPAGGRIGYVKIFIVVSVFIIIMACINFVSLATAKAITRAKEVGVRKVTGATRKLIAVQFIIESFLLTSISYLISLGLTSILLPGYNLLLQTKIVFNPWSGEFMVFSFLLVVGISFLAGSYPALVMSSFRPVHVLKGIFPPILGGNTLRQILVVIQFTITIVLVASALIIYDQINFIQQKDLGFNRLSVLTYRGENMKQEKLESMKNEISNLPGVLSVSRAHEYLTSIGNQTNGFTWPGKPDQAEHFVRVLMVDYNFMETMDMKLMSGRFFSEDFHDTSSFILSRKAANLMGLKNPIEQSVSLEGWELHGSVVGVVEDLHVRSLYEDVDPVVFVCVPDELGLFYIRFDPSQTQIVVKGMEKLHKHHNPAYPFQYSFLDDRFESIYETDRTTGRLAIVFTVVSLLIAGLGLLGLAAYTTERRRKEISIRKTLGASVSVLVMGLSWDFLKINLIALVPGCLITYYTMNHYLNGYAFHTTIGLGRLTLTALLIILFTMFIVVYEIMKAASVNPADALRRN